MTARKNTRSRNSRKQRANRQQRTLSPPRHARPEIDSLIVRSVQRWALVAVALIIAFDLAILRSYPFPNALGSGRAVFYTLLGAATVLISVVVTFLGYRLASMQVVRRRRTLFIIFLPATAIIASAFSFMLLAAPR
jgi:hypothetical protein